MLNLSERSRRSTGLQALHDCLSRARKLAGTDLTALGRVGRAAEEVKLIDQTYDVCQRSKRMLEQIEADEWPWDNLPGFSRGLSRGLSYLSFLSASESGIDLVLVVCDILAHQGGETDLIGTLQSATEWWEGLGKLDDLMLEVRVLLDGLPEEKSAKWISQLGKLVDQLIMQLE